MVQRIQMDDAAMFSLYRIVNEVADLSYRVREWENLEDHFHSLEKSFKPFWVRLQHIETPDDLAVHAPTLLEEWALCQDVDIVELNGFAQNLKYIHKPFEPDSTANYPDLRKGIATLVAIGTNHIPSALTHGVLDDLKKQAEAFNNVLQGQIANPRIMKWYELNHLCEVTYRLHMRIHQDFDEVREILAPLKQGLKEICKRFRQLRVQLARIKDHIPQQSDLSFADLDAFIDETLDQMSTSILPLLEAKMPKLCKVIDEVANLSYRIREWENLEDHFHSLEKSFKPYWSIVQPIQDPGNLPVHAPTLLELWALCRDVDIPELNGFAQNLKYIHKPFEPNSTTNYPDPRVGIEALVDLCRSIDEALINASFKKVQDDSRKFQSILTGQLTTHRTMMNDEVGQLCQLVHELRERLRGETKSFQKNIAPAEEDGKPLSVFISYSHHDQAFCEELKNHLSNLKRQNIIASWYDGDISPGSEWKQQINEHLSTDQIILLLISADFMASDFCYSIEMTQAIARHDANQACVIPIIVRPTDWKGSPFAKLKVLPTDGKAVSNWPTHDNAFEDVVQGIRKAIDDLKKKVALPNS